MLNPARLSRYTVAVLTAGVLCGCSLRAKNIKPTTPYDFSQIFQMAKYAQSVYADSETIRAVCLPAFNQVYTKRIETTNNQYFLATSSLTQTHLISIAGTSNIENVLLDADLSHEFVPSLQITLHRGFAKAARLIYEDVRPRLVAGYRIQLTGHSLGGAEAVILGMELKAAGTPAERIITFGQPRVTNQAGVDAFKDLPLTRVINQNDMVPEMPLDPFRHIGPELVLFPGTAYALVERRPLSPEAVLAAWQALRNHQPPAELPHHYISSYLTNLETKRSESQLTPL